MLLNGLQRCLALTKPAEILLDKLQHRKCPVFENICICLAMQSWIKTEEILETKKEIAMVVPDPSAEGPSLSFAVQAHTIMMWRSTTPLLSSRSQPAGTKSTYSMFFCLCQRKIFFRVKPESWLSSAFYTVLPWKMVKNPSFSCLFHSVSKRKQMMCLPWNVLVFG